MLALWDKNQNRFRAPCSSSPGAPCCPCSVASGSESHRNTLSNRPQKSGKENEAAVKGCRVSYKPKPMTTCHQKTTPLHSARCVFCISSSCRVEQHALNDEPERKAKLCSSKKSAFEDCIPAILPSGGSLAQGSMDWTLHDLNTEPWGQNPSTLKKHLIIVDKRYPQQKPPVSKP